MKKDLGRFRRGELIAGYIWWGMFLIGSSFVVSFAFLLSGTDADQLTSDPQTYALLNLGVSLLNFLGAVLIFRHFLAGQFRRLRARGTRTVTDLLLGGCVIYVAMFAAGLLSGIVKTIFRVQEEVNPNQEAVESILGAKPWVGILLILVCAPVTEELLNRGLVFNPLCRVSRPLAYIVSMLVFSAIHVVGSAPYVPLGDTISNFIIYCAPGFGLCWIYDRSETIWSPIFLHMLYNGSILALQMLPQLSS